MNSVTCQASSELHKPVTPREVPVDALAGLTPRVWGNHATAATRARSAHKAKDPRQPMPACSATGKLAPAAIAALRANAVEYVLVMRPVRSGNSRFTRLGKSTLPTAIAAPRTAVPKNSAATAPAERSRMPAASTSRLASNTRSIPNRRANRGAIGDSTANAKSGNPVSRPATPLDIPVDVEI